MKLNILNKYGSFDINLFKIGLLFSDNSLNVTFVVELKIYSLLIENSTLFHQLKQLKHHQMKLIC